MPELLEGYAFTIQWFPGHMTKAKRQMESELRMVDVVVELLDARIPRASANPLLKGLIGSKVKIVALNKTDMAAPLATKAWLTYFKEAGLKALEVDCQKGRGVKALLTAMREAGQPVIDKWLKKGVRNHPIRIMIVGIPNVGKSTLINAILPGTKVKTGEISTYHNKGMHTTTFSEMFSVDGDGYIIDTPGIKGFGTFDMEEEEIGHYFPEIFKVSSECKYGNCTHRHEPGCAVHKAVEEHLISESRYTSCLLYTSDAADE